MVRIPTLHAPELFALLLGFGLLAAAAPRARADDGVTEVESPEIVTRRFGAYQEPLPVALAPVGAAPCGGPFCGGPYWGGAPYWNGGPYWGGAPYWGGSAYWYGGPWGGWPWGSFGGYYPRFYYPYGYGFSGGQLPYWGLAGNGYGFGSFAQAGYLAQPPQPVLSREAADLLGTRAAGPFYW